MYQSTNCIRANSKLVSPILETQPFLPLMTSPLLQCICIRSAPSPPCLPVVTFSSQHNSSLNKCMNLHVASISCIINHRSMNEITKMKCEIRPLNEPLILNCLFYPPFIHQFPTIPPLPPLFLPPSSLFLISLTSSLSSIIIQPMFVSTWANSFIRASFLVRPIFGPQSSPLTPPLPIL
jgi:hypothetical protein